MKAVKIKNIVIAYPEGRIDNNSAHHYRHQLELLIAKYNNCDLVVNMGNVPSISSHGIAVLVYMAKKLVINDRSLSICCPTPLVKEILSILNIDYLNRFPTEEYAIRTILTAAVNA